MVNILQRPKSIGELFAEQIGGGFQRGVDQGMQTVSSLRSKSSSENDPLLKERYKELLGQQHEEEEEDQLRAELDELDALSEDYSEHFLKATPVTKSGRAKLARAAGISTEGAQKSAKLDKFGLWVADKAYTKYNKGQVSDNKMKIIQSMAPSSKLSKAENKARIDSLRSLMKKKGTITDSDMQNAQKKVARSAAKTKGTTKVLSPSGNVVEIPNDQVEAAISAGGSLA